MSFLPLVASSGPALLLGSLEAGVAPPTTKRLRVPSTDPLTIFASTVTATTTFVNSKMKELTALSLKVAAIDCTMEEKGFIKSFLLAPPPILPILHIDFASVQKAVDAIFLESAIKSSRALQTNMRDRIIAISDELGSYEALTFRVDLGYLIVAIGEEVVDPIQRELVIQDFKK